MSYQWDSNLETGYEKVDNQHKQLIAVLNDLIEASKEGKKDEVFKVLEFLNSYTIIHFKTEEDLQLKYEYDDYAVHKQYHDAFKVNVANFSKRLAEEGSSFDLLGVITETIGDWFINHIKGDDFRMAAFIKSKENLLA